MAERSMIRRELEAFVKEKQRLMEYSLKQEIKRHFRVRRFDDIPDAKLGEALQYASHMVNGAIAGKVMDEALSAFLRGSQQTINLKNRIETRLRKRYGCEYWARMESGQAVEAVKKAIGDQNIWEFAYKPD